MASSSRVWISGSGSVPGRAGTTGLRRWKSFRGNSSVKNAASHFAYWDDAGST